jgi:glutaredoxin
MRLTWLLLLASVAGGVHWMLDEERDPGERSTPFATQSPETLSPDDPRRLTGDTKIVMIAAEWCGYCRKQQKDFEQAGVRYRVLDYDQAEGEAASRALGTRGVPITVIGQNVVAGYRTSQLDAHLEPLGYDVY